MIPININEKFTDGTVLVSDGAWGTELARHGTGTGGAPELLNTDAPAAVTSVARSYVDAGADIILTNTFGANPFKLEKAGLAARTAELNRAGTELSKRAAGTDAAVFASMGPTGEFIAPLGTKTETEFVACFKEQAAALAAGGADGIVIETMTDLGEAGAALSAVREATDLPVVVSFTFDKGPKGFATIMGVTPAQAAEAMTAAGADLVGSNCGAGVENMIGIARELRSATDLPLWVKANAGMPRLVDGETVFLETPDETAARIPELLDAGANVVGGCCGTTPDHIRAIAAAVRRRTA